MRRFNSIEIKVYNKMSERKMSIAMNKISFGGGGREGGGIMHRIDCSELNYLIYFYSL